MKPLASVLVPTRDRYEYLRDTLASVASQVKQENAELIVIYDDGHHPQTQDLTESFGGKYLALDHQHGLNAARNAAIAVARSDLLCFLDDDVRVWDGWLSSMIAGAELYPDAQVFTGPIVPVADNPKLKLCHCDVIPITNCDLGGSDCRAENAWGANLTIRRSALDLAGKFDETRELYGDEEEWQSGFKSAGGEIMYLHQAGLYHCRNREDSQFVNMAKALYKRGFPSRRYDVHKGIAPSAATEAITTARCVAHSLRNRCHYGLLMAAHSSGRLVEALKTSHPQTTSIEQVPDFLSGQSGVHGRRSKLRARFQDTVVKIGLIEKRRQLRPAAQAESIESILILSVVRKQNADNFRNIRKELDNSIHGIAGLTRSPQPARGKWFNLNTLLDTIDLDEFDRVIVIDDDVTLPKGFLDNFVMLCNKFKLELAQPAHLRSGYCAWPVTRVRPNVLARETRFVEIGPVTMFTRIAAKELLPFPQLEMGWGLDTHWAAIAESNGWKIGVVDATPILHPNPIAEDYSRAAAIAEASEFLADRPYMKTPETHQTIATHRTL